MKGLASFVCSFLGLAVAAAPAFAQGSLGSETTHIVLVQDCTDAGWDAGDVGTKCFESLSSLNDYIWGSSGIFPTASTPLTVDIGPGEFSGGLDCPDGEGHTTFRGAGRDRTVIKKSGTWLQLGVHAVNCVALAFQDLSVVADSTDSDIGYAVYWSGGGSSSWTDVNLTGDSTGWYDVGCGGESTDAPSGSHNFWGTNVAGGKFGYYAECGETWFYGGEIGAFSSLLGSFHNKMTGVWVAHRGEVHLNGSAVRVSTKGVSSGSGTAYGARVGPSGNTLSTPSGYGEFHSHGGLVTVKTENLSGVAAVGINVNDSSGAGDAKSHTHETAFVVKGGSTSTRLTGSGTFESPFQWEARTSPPTAGGAQDGQDTYVETDCDSSGCSSGSDPHLMIYKSGCSSSPWFDTVRNACRN
jgi:hypothetical protein